MKSHVLAVAEAELRVYKVVVMARVSAIVACLLIGLIAIQPIGASDPWSKLRRPLHLPRIEPGAACPISSVDRRIDWERVNIFGSSGTGRGPVYPGIGSQGGRLSLRPDNYGGPWADDKVFWYVLPSYRGPVLIRGRRLNGPQRLGFNGALAPERELRIESHQSVSWSGQPRGSRGIPSSIRARASGCYGVQIDGTTFSRVVVLRIVVP